MRLAFKSFRVEFNNSLCPRRADQNPTVFQIYLKAVAVAQFKHFFARYLFYVGKILRLKFFNIFFSFFRNRHIYTGVRRIAVECGKLMVKPCNILPRKTHNFQKQTNG